jgi:hypothetical protein
MRVLSSMCALAMLLGACGCRQAQPQPMIYYPQQQQCVPCCPSTTPCAPAPVSPGATLQPIPSSNPAPSLPPTYTPSSGLGAPR